MPTERQHAISALQEITTALRNDDDEHAQALYMKFRQAQGSLQGLDDDIAIIMMKIGEYFSSPEFWVYHGISTKDVILAEYQDILEEGISNQSNL